MISTSPLESERVQFPDTGADPLQANLLLACLGGSEREALRAAGTTVSLSLRQRLYEAGDPITHVYFPYSGLVSMLASSRDGSSVEVGPVGHDGMVGLPVFLGGDTDPLEAFVQVAPVHALRLEADDFHMTIERLPGLQRVLRLYVQWVYYGMAQWVLCARLHPAEERLARWLLMSHDRLGSEAFPLTHEFIAEMLGTRRATVTIAAGQLRAAGLVDYHRGVVTILDRLGLEQASCECWRASNAEYERLIGQTLGLTGPAR